VLHDMVARLAEKAGIVKPTIHIIDARINHVDPMAIPMRFNAAATTDKQTKLLIGDMFLEHLTGNAQGKVVTPELTALIGHEFGHLKHDIGDFSLRKYSNKMPLVGLLTGMGGLALYRHMQHKPKEQQEKEFQEGSETIKRASGVLSRAGHLALVTGQYLAAGALGLTVGVMAFRDINHFCEFRADRHAVKMLDGNVDAVMNMLYKLQSPPEHVLKTLGNDTLMALKGTDKEDMSLDTINKINRYKGWLSHPSTEVRVARLEEMRVKPRIKGKEEAVHHDDSDMFDIGHGFKGKKTPPDESPTHRVSHTHHDDHIRDDHGHDYGMDIGA